mmetsp:Transcript_81999/g.232241  ORF Transcript_81999/g.232241 Transcript_81999/m.232241 type:complete len:300 (-) Transcript_81999:247-1146(-)
MVHVGAQARVTRVARHTIVHPFQEYIHTPVQSCQPAAAAAAIHAARPTIAAARRPEGVGRVEQLVLGGVLFVVLSIVPVQLHHVGRVRVLASVVLRDRPAWTVMPVWAVRVLLLLIQQHARSEALLENRELLLGGEHLVRYVGRLVVARPVNLLADPRGARELLRNTHGVAPELFRDVGTQRGALGQLEQPALEVVDQPVREVLFLRRPLPLAAPLQPARVVHAARAAHRRRLALRAHRARGRSRQVHLCGRRRIVVLVFGLGARLLDVSLYDPPCAHPRPARSPCVSSAAAARRRLRR